MLKITRIHVKNFKSIWDCTFELKDLQLLIGPNNSGKTNFLKVFEFLRDVTDQYRVQNINVSNLRFQHKEFHDNEKKLGRYPDPIEITVELTDTTVSAPFYYYYKIELFYLNNLDKKFNHFNSHNSSDNQLLGVRTKPLSNGEFRNISASDIKFLQKHFERIQVNKNNTSKLSEEQFPNELIKNPHGFQAENSYLVYITKSSIEVLGHSQGLGTFLNGWMNDKYMVDLILQVKNLFQQFVIYRPETHYIKLSVEKFTNEAFVNQDASNIVSYLEGLQSSDPERFNRINKELEKCIPDFTGYNFETISVPDKNNEVQGFRFLRLKDKFGVNHYAEDISEGTLYFLMLFAIITQKNMPSVLIIEEPETNIHPRRISEIMEYIFKLREQFPNMSIILTTHHPYVVDFFKDMTNRVWVFDTENGETKIRNLERDVISPSNENLKKSEMEPIDYSSSLGEHWAMGFLGGVPKPVLR